MKKNFRHQVNSAELLSQCMGMSFEEIGRYLLKFHQELVIDDASLCTNPIAKQIIEETYDYREKQSKKATKRWDLPIVQSNTTSGECQQKSEPVKVDVPNDPFYDIPVPKTYAPEKCMEIIMKNINTGKIQFKSGYFEELVEIPQKVHTQQELNELILKYCTTN